MAKTITLTDRRGRKAEVEPGSPAEAHFRAHGFAEPRRAPRRRPAKAQNKSRPGQKNRA